jgi:quinol-cytochrome oxidoreductase complex cytochrome b subunit
LFVSLKEVFRAERERTVPGHVNLLHYLGALAFIFFLLQIATGILLMIYYRPSVAAAYYSTAVIMDEVRVGWLIRSLHYWGGHLVILLILLHVIRVYFSRAYQSPRQLTWAAGICLLIVALALAFTGTLLPWDQYAYWYTDSARRTISGIPGIGPALLALLWGGWELGEEVLLRFYAFHIAVLPWLAFLCLFLHMVLVWRLGLKAPAVTQRPHASPTPFFPDFLLNLMIVVFLVGGLLLSVALILPPPLLEAADPLTPLVDARPPWYFLPLRELLLHVSRGLATLGLGAFFVVLFLVPLLDREEVQPAWKRALQRGLGLAVIALWLFLATKGYLR